MPTRNICHFANALKLPNIYFTTLSSLALKMSSKALMHQNVSFIVCGEKQELYGEIDFRLPNTYLLCLHFCHFIGKDFWEDLYSKGYMKYLTGPSTFFIILSAIIAMPWLNSYMIDVHRK